jgi:hypothetical protein
VQVPVSINVLDDIVVALFNGCTDTEVEVDVFAAAETEVSGESASSGGRQEGQSATSAPHHSLRENL